MPNMELKKSPMPVQDAYARICNFDEVALGYTYETAVNEAKRCLNCKHKPCVSGCPVEIDIPAFLAKVAAEDMEGAYEVLSRSTSLPAGCGRVCPQESQCEGKCVRGIKVVGAGPSGMTAAGDLAKLGYEVTIFEALHLAGGVLVYGIPEFRLPKAIVQHEIENLKELGVDIQTDMVIGKVLTIDELFEMGYEAVFVGSGAGLPRFMNIPGESLNGVYSANEFLTRINLMKAFRKDSSTPVQKAEAVAVVGGGNVAMDAARCAKRLGAQKVYIVYRRGMEELPARKEEVEHAEEEQIIFRTLCNPVEILDDGAGKVGGIRCVEMELGEPDESGRRRPVEKKGSEFEIEVDSVIMAIGTSPNPLIRSTTPGLEANRHGCLITKDESGKTSREGVWAGGDAVTGAATVILAMGAGKQAARAIDEALRNR